MESSVVDAIHCKDKEIMRLPQKSAYRSLQIVLTGTKWPFLLPYVGKIKSLNWKTRINAIHMR